MADAVKNTDRELYREPAAVGLEYYAPSIHATEAGGIGINVGGRVLVKPLADWHALALRADALEALEAENAKMREVLTKVAEYKPSIARSKLDRMWRGFTTGSGYAPVPDLQEDAALCDLIQFDDHRKLARAALSQEPTDG